jgi:hypothetical protein
MAEGNLRLAHEASLPRVGRARVLPRTSFMCSTGRPFKVLLCQSAGFLALIAVCLFDELVRLSSLLFGEGAYLVEFQESALKMLLILCVWLLVSGSTRRILAQTQHLEQFMKLCAWCHRIEHQGRWIPLEEFLKLSLDRPTSHGICQDCLEKKKAELSLGAGNGLGARPSPQLSLRLDEQSHAHRAH